MNSAEISEKDNEGEKERIGKSFGFLIVVVIFIIALLVMAKYIDIRIKTADYKIEAARLRTEWAETRVTKARNEVDYWKTKYTEGLEKIISLCRGK
jgi:hypothetical protein